MEQFSFLPVMTINQQRSDLVKTRDQVFNAKCCLHAHSHSRSLVISKYVSGSLPSMLARFCQRFQQILHARLGTGKTCAQSICMCCCGCTSAKQISAPQCSLHPACLHLQENHVPTRTQSNTTLIHHPTHPPNPCYPHLLSTPTKQRGQWEKRVKLVIRWCFAA